MKTHAHAPCSPPTIHRHQSPHTRGPTLARTHTTCMTELTPWHNEPLPSCGTVWYTLPPRRATGKTLPRAGVKVAPAQAALLVWPMPAPLLSRRARRLTAQYGRARCGPPGRSWETSVTGQSRLKCPIRLHRKHLAKPLPPVVRGEPPAGFLSAPRAGVGGVPWAVAPAEPDGPAGLAGPAGPGPASTWSAHMKWPHVPHL